MWVRVTRIACGVALLFVTAVAAQPTWATLPTPNQPILVVQDNTSADPYQNFIPELLTTEGFNGFQVAQLGDLTSAFLSTYDVVILPRLTLTAAQVTLFQNYVSAGGTLVGFRPDVRLATVFGVASLGTTLQEAWLKMDPTTVFAPSLDSEAMRFHGVADLYSFNGASALATLYNTPAISTTSPAAAVNNFGQGKAILFSFDLTQSIVLMRQGNPAWAGYPNNHDGFNTMRASQMFMDKNSGQFWNDLGDGALNDVPQADIQLRLLSNAITLTNAAKRPLPKLWYFPNQNRAQLLMSGDDHSYPVADALAEINSIGSYGGLFSYNLWYPFGSVSNSQVNTWLAAGDSMAIHFNDTAEVDSSGVGGSKATWNGMQSVINTAITSFAATYPSAPFPVTTRNHFLIWVSNDANGTPDQVAQAKLFQNNGIQLDTSFSAFPNRWGYMNGSGLPMKFLDPVAGSVIPMYEQATQYEDDVQAISGSYSTNWDQATAQSHYVQSLSDSSSKYNTVITMLWHPENWSNVGSDVQSALQYAKAQSIPISSTGAWLNFWQARAATAVSMPLFASGTLSFTATGTPAGLTLLVPQASGSNKAVSTFQMDGVSQSYTVAKYQGVMYASVVLTAGTHNISVSYVTAGRILGQISPSQAAASTSVQVQGGSITESVSVASDGTYVAGPLPAGTYTVTPSSSGYAFSPTFQSVPLGTTDLTNVNFTATSSGETLFTTQTPIVTNASDGPGANYELGTSFTSSVAGQIIAIRFWKASSESGTHTGKIWSSTGALLASVTFVNESASGWQQRALSAPLSIAANTTYVVSVNTAGAFYVATTGGLSAQVNNIDLHSVVGNNGLYGTSGAFPTNSYQSTNYFRDILFVPGATYSVSGAITPSPSGSGATVTLTLGSATIATATANSSGNYTFASAANGTYSVTPTKAGYAFSPTSAPANVNNANVTVATFTATAVPTYTVSGSITPGTSGSGTTVTLTLGGSTVATGTADSSGNYSITGVPSGNYTDTPTKAGFTFTPTTASANVSNANVVVATFTATANPVTQSLFTTQTPATTNDSDGAGVNYELGTALSSDIAGQITAVRFWKASNETGTHTGRIWSSAGALLASVTFANETASGWQQQALTTQISIAANTTYVVSVNTGGTYYVATNSGLSSQVNNADLHSVVGNNGLYGTTGTFPTNSYQGSNYFRDIAFSPGAVTTGPPASIVAVAGAPQSAVVGTAFSAALLATVKDANNNPVSGVSVTFVAPGTGASGTFGGSATVTTNSSGVATAPTFTANTVAGTYTVTASVSGVSTPASFTLTNNPGPATTITATGGTPQNATIGTAFTTALQATVKDASNNPVSGVTVTFTAPAQTGASGTFAGGANTAFTNASGVATAAVFTANSLAGGPYNVAASVSGVATAANFALTNTAGLAATITATAGTPQSAPFNTAFASTLQATVKDASNNPVSGITVTFAAPAQTGASGTFAGGVNTAITTASGVATSVVFTANSIAGGPYNVAATVSGVATPANFSLTNTSGTPASIGATSGSSQSTAVGTAFASTLQATVNDASNNPVSGVTVTFTAPAQTGASGTFAGGLNTAVTNASGVATSGVFTANSIAGGPYNVAASVSGVATAANFALTNTAGSAAAITATGGTPQNATISTAFSNPLQATVKDASNNPVSGVTVTFTAPAQTGASSTFAGGVNTAVTNASGVATSAVFTANTIAGGPYNMAASVSGVATAANFALTNTAGPAATITATGGTPQSTKVSTAFTTALQATVKDASNNPVSGVTVTFAAPAQTGASGTVAGGVNTAVTNANGVATSVVFTANSIAGGPYNVAASVSGVATAANFALTNTAGSAAAITATGGTPQTATISTAFTAALQATVKDASNNPVSGVTVTFAAPGQTGASGTFVGGVNTAVTNASGIATSGVFTANSIVGGPYNVAATAPGVATAANFALTNTAGPAATITATAGTPQSAPFNTAFASTLQATVKDASNNPVSGVTVAFTAPAQTGASGTFASGANTAVTNASGVATSAVFTANSISGGPYNVAATVSGVATPANFSLTNTSGTPASIGATSGSSQSTAVGTAFASTLQATVNDASNNPVSGVTVTFTAPAQTGASGTFAGGLNTAVTNASGVATSGVFTANSIAGGPYNVAASVSGVATAANFALTNTAGSAAAITATGGTPQNATISTAFSNPLQATVKDASNNPVSGVTVTFTAPAQTGASGTFAGGVNTAVTDAGGVATSAIFTANNIAGGPYNVAATVSGVATAANFALTNKAGAAAAITATAGTPQTATISTAFTTALQATVKDASNNPVSGVTVTFIAPAQTGASGTFAGGANTAITNASGVATSVVFTANSIAGGPYNVAASVSGVATAANFALTNATGAAAAITATQGTPQNATIGTAFTTAFQATVKDAGNNPVSGVTVTFTAPAQTGASGTFAGGSNTAISNASGVATAAVFTANSIAGGPYNVAASVSGVATAANFALTNTAGPAATITATGGTPQSATISTAFTTTLKATVKDASNNPVSGVTVTFTAPAQTGASGTFAGGLNTAVTNASGVATAAVFTANSIAGSYTVTANVPGVIATASFSLTNSTAAPIAIDVTTSTDRGTGATTIASPSFATASANELLLAYISTDDPGSGTNISVSGVAGGGLTWVLVQRTNVQRGTSEIWRAFATTALSGVTVTATMSKSVAASITVMSFTGVNTTGTNGSGAIGAIGTGNASAGAPTASLVTTKSNSLVVGVGNDFDNAISRTPGANQAVVHQYLSTTGDTYWVQRVTTLSPAGTALTINDTAPTTDRYNLSICEIVGQ